MSCERFRPALAAHAGGADLDVAAAQHLSACATCRRLVETQRQVLAELDAELGRSLSIAASPDFAARVVRAARNIDTVPARRGIPAPVWAGLGVAAAIALAVWVGADFRLKPEATQTTSDGTRRSPEAAPTSTTDVRLKPGTVQTPGSAAPECVASGFSRKAANGGCRAAPLGALRPDMQPRPGSRRLNPDPPVIVEPARALAIQRLRELMTQGRLDEQTLPPPVTPEASLAELAIAPLEVTEIRVPDVQIVSRPPAAPQRQ